MKIGASNSRDGLQIKFREFLRNIYIMEGKFNDVYKRIRLGGDPALWVVLAGLAAVSLLVIYSSTASMAYRLLDGDTLHFVGKQAAILIASFAIVVSVHLINYQWYAKLATIGYVISLLCMIATFFIGISLNNAARWLAIPGTSMTFQPSDLMRVTLVLILARQLAQRQKDIAHMILIPKISHFIGGTKDLKKFRSILFNNTIPLLGPVVISCGLIFISNFSTAAITFLSCLIMLYLGRVRIRELLRLIGLAIVCVVFALIVMKSLNFGRVDTWINRITSFVGVGDSVDSDDDLQKEQARIAVSTGGLFGKGPGLSTQRANLPHSYSDFAYAFIIEEYGMVGGIVCLILYLWLFYRAILIFMRCGTAFPSLLVLGLALMIVIQALVNMAVSVGLGPVTGQTLPIISLGGSSLFFTSLALGMIMGVSRQVQEKSLDTPKAESFFK